MNGFDIAIIVVLALCLIIGFSKGLIKTGLSLLSWGVSMALIYFVAGKLGALLMNTGLGGTVNNFFGNIFGGIEGMQGTVAVNAAGDKIILETGVTLASALGSMFIPTMLHSSITGFFNAGMTMSQGMSAAMTTLMGTAIASILLILATSIVFAIISCIIKRSMRGKKVGAINRILGALLYIAVGVFIVSLLMMIIDFMSPLSFMAPVIEMRDAGKISELFVKYNPITLIINLIGGKL